VTAQTANLNAWNDLLRLILGCKLKAKIMIAQLTAVYARAEEMSNIILSLK